jgi:glucosamine-6-phosphate deaminase
MTTSSTERIPVRVLDNPADVSVAVAAEISTLIRDRQAKGLPCVLGLATGSTPTGVYDELIRLHREEELSFHNVETFNLDEYFPMHPEALQSYRRFMQEHLFDHVDIDPSRTHLPDGLIAEEDVEAWCVKWEADIEAAGGIDLQLLGIGRTGHVGFNEPGSSPTSTTRLITLDRVTRIDAASDFFGESQVPRRAITMGVGTILAAKAIRLIAFGEKKAPVVRQSVEGEVDSAIAASHLQGHRDARFMLDSAAAAQLTRCRSPWLIGRVDWTPMRIRQAVVWLAEQTDTAILKLTDEHYNEHHLQELLASHGPAYNINLAVFRDMQSTITGWPAGKPRKARRGGESIADASEQFPKRIVIFSPHPDDDVISMGGTFCRLVDQGHEVHVAYQTSGCIAVFDDNVLDRANFLRSIGRAFDIDMGGLDEQIEDDVLRKVPGQVDSEHVRIVKTLIRRSEARSGARLCGLQNERCHFLDLPFYETGRVRKRPLSDTDIDKCVNLLEQVKPHQVYAAGDLSDPHGTHRTCLVAVTNAVDRVESQPWAKGLETWLYRGAWQEWEPERIDMAVPLSPSELGRKIAAIHRHESQKDKALFPGDDSREFWQRAEARNRATAKLYDQLGLSEYEAIEAFVQWHSTASPTAVSLTAQGAHEA